VFAIALLQRRRKPVRQLALRGAKETQHALPIVVGQQVRRIGSAQEMHVLAGGLLNGVVQQFAQKRTGMRRVEDHEPLHQPWMAIGQAPGQRTAPVVGDHAGGGGAWAFDGDQRRQVLQQVLGLVLLDPGRLAGAAKAAQVRGHAAPLRAEMRQQAFPDETALREAMQEQQQGLAGLAADAAMQMDAVRQFADAGGHHVALLAGRWLHERLRALILGAVGCARRRGCDASVCSSG
jgi:hypothetical protein